MHAPPTSPPALAPHRFPADRPRSQPSRLASPPSPHPFTRLAALIASALGAAGIAAAQEAASSKDQTVSLLPVVVTATRYAVPVTDAPAEVDVVSRAQIERRNAYRLGDALAEVPGLTLRGSAFGEAFPASGAGSISLRGIPRTPRTLVLVDGQPLNNALSGAVNLSSIALDDVDRIEVLHGPYSAQYGGHAMGGVIQILTAPPTRRNLVVKAGAGGGDIRQWGTSLVWRDRLANGLGWSITAGTRRSDGWDDSDQVVKTPTTGTGTLPVAGAVPTRTPDGRLAYLLGTRGARPWDQTNGGATLYYDLSPDTRIAAGIAYSEYHTRYSGPVSFLTNGSGAPVTSGNLVVDGTRRIVLSPSDFLTQTPSGERDTRSFARLEHRTAGGHLLKASVGYLDHGFRFPLPAATARYESGPGEFADQPNNRLDVDANGHFLLTDRLSLTAGASHNRNRLHRSSYAVSYWRDIATRTGVKSESMGETVNDAVYAEFQWVPIDRLTVYAGARHDRFETEGRVIQNTAPVFDRSYASRGDSQTSPKLALVYEAAKHLTLRASYGTGFRAPTLLDLYTRSTTPSSVAGQFIVTEPAPDLKPERVEAFELGADWHRDEARLSATVYRQTLKDLFYRKRVNPLLNQTVNAGEARVDGIEASARWPLGWQGLRVFASFAHNFRYTITRNDALPASVGKKLTDVVEDTASIGLEGDRGPWSGYAALRHAGPAFGSGDDLNANTTQGVYGAWDRYTVADVKLSRRLAHGLTASVAVDNLFDQTYYAFYRQPGRTFYVELKAEF